MTDLNAAIRAAVGTPRQEGDPKSAGTTPATSAALNNIATNGALFNQGLGRLAQALANLKTTWGG